MNLEELKEHFKVTLSEEPGNFYFKDGIQNRRTITIGNKLYHSLIFMGSITGCGLVAVKGTSSITSWTNEQLDMIWRYMRNEKVGAIMATCGPHTPKQTRDKLLEQGFEEVISFNNWYDGDNWMQTILVKKLPKTFE